MSAASASALDTIPFAERTAIRSLFLFDSRRASRARGQRRLARREVGFRLLDLGVKRDGSIRAITCPFLTWELKSAPSDWIVPETWLPTWTVTTAESVPVAETVVTRSPRSALAVLNPPAFARGQNQYVPAPIAARRRTAATAIQRL